MGDVLCVVESVKAASDVYAPVGGLLFGGVFEYLRFLLDSHWSAGSFLTETILVAAGTGAFLLADGLLRPLEDLPDLEEAMESDDKEEDGEDDELT